jgi:hypothetical protein
MKKLKFLGGFLAALALVSLSGAAFNIFQPATGILVGNASTYVTTAAASSDVIALWSGSCSGSSFLNGAGACATPGGGATTGSFTGTLTGLTTVVTTTCNYTIVGNAVTITCGLASGVSNSTQFRITGIPSLLTPTTSANGVWGALSYGCENASANVLCMVSIQNVTSPTFIFYVCSTFTSCSNTGWDSSGTTKGIAQLGLSIAYNL